jgi:hypothetical protein
MMPNQLLVPVLGNIRSLIIWLLVGLAAGVGGTAWTVWRRDYEMRESLLGQARRMAQTLHTKDIEALSGSDADLDSPIYQRLKKVLAKFCQTHRECRFVYLMGCRPDGTVFLFVDSENPASEDYSPPGQVYDEAGIVEAIVFDNGESSVHGPTPDRWGTWVSAYVPIYDPWTDTVVALLGMDIDASDWNRHLARAAVLPVVLTLALIVTLTAASGLATRRRRLGAAAPSWLQYLEPGAVLMVGLVLTLFAARTACNNESFNRAQLFEKLAESETYGVADVFLDLQHAELESLARFYECSVDVTADEFARFTTPLTDNPAVHAWGWIAAVPVAEQEAFERSVRDKDLPEFRIWQRNERGERTPAAGREMYFPVVLVSPLEGNEARWGSTSDRSPFDARR